MFKVNDKDDRTTPFTSCSSVSIVNFEHVNDDWVMNLDLTHYRPVLLFYIPWKHQKTFRFSDVFKRYRKAKPGCNGLIRPIQELECFCSILTFQMLFLCPYLSAKQIYRHGRVKQKHWFINTFREHEISEGQIVPFLQNTSGPHVYKRSIGQIPAHHRNKNTKTMPYNSVFRVFIVDFVQVFTHSQQLYFTSFSSVFIVDFEQVNVCWVGN